MWVKTKDVFKHFDGKAKTAAALGIAVPSVYVWGIYPPPLRQLQIESITAGELKAEAACDKFRVPTAAM